jgi:hypothetical protein
MARMQSGFKRKKKKTCIASKLSGASDSIASGHQLDLLYERFGMLSACHY